MSSSAGGSSGRQQANKRTLTLDLNGPAKKTRLGVPSSTVASSNGGAPPILTTPDVQMLKLSSPELAKFLNSNQTLATPTPSGYLFPKTVTEEQELYAKGFEVALQNMHNGGTGQPNETAISTIERATAAHRSTQQQQQQQLRPPPPPPLLVLPPALTSSSRPSSGASGSVDSSEGVYVKQEEDDDDDEDDSSDDDGSLRGRNSGMSPIDMESQEKIKLERKRMRNRVAASKCRKRKLERISQLDDKVQKLKGENGELAGVVKKLKEAVANLKQEVLDHMSSGCRIPIADLSA